MKAFKNICCIGDGFVGEPIMTVIASQYLEITVKIADINPERIALWNHDDLLHTDRVLIGGDNTPSRKAAKEALCSIYEHLFSKERLSEVRNFRRRMSECSMFQI